MFLSNDDYQIEIIKDNQYTLFSSDNKFYDDVIQMADYTRNDYICVYCVCIYSDMGEHKIALIGRGFGSIENSAVLKDNVLVILIDDYLVFFNLISKRLEKKIKIIDFGTGIELYSFEDGFIVNVETEIINVDKFGNKIWSFSGRDIWVTENGGSSINILGDTILLKNFEGQTYLLDRFGKEITNT